MLCINNANTDIFFNLAAEEYLFGNASEPTFMLWQNEPCVVLGRHQDLRAEVDLDFIREKGIRLARRFSGGGTVYQDTGNINLTFIESDSNPDFDKFTRQMQDFLSGMGIHASMDERHALYIDGLKISGSSQYIRGKKMLHHATLLFSSDLPSLESALNCPKDHPEISVPAESWRYVKSVKSPVTNIGVHLPSPLTVEAFRARLFHHFLNNGSGNRQHSFTPGDIEAISRIMQAKYATPDWTFQAKSII